MARPDAAFLLQTAAAAAGALRRRLIGAPAPAVLPERPPAYALPAPRAAARRAADGRVGWAAGRVAWPPGGDPFSAADALSRLHRFDWLVDLARLGPEGREEGARLAALWEARWGRAFAAPPWAAPVAAARLRALAVVAGAGPHPVVARLLAQAAAAAAAAPAPPADARADWDQAVGLALATGRAARLARAAERALLADGVHASRAPGATLEAAFDLARACAATPQAAGLRAAAARAAAAARFFQCGRDRLASFQGDGGARPDLADLPAGGAPPAFAPHGRYQRLAAGGLVGLMDAGPPPPPGWGRRPHAAPLAIEIAADGAPLIVCCGGFAGDPRWEEAAAQTAAHSTLVVDGRTIEASRFNVVARRRDTPDGPALDAAHDGYRAPFGLTHERSLAFDAAGARITGEDRLAAPVGAGAARPADFAIRFHLAAGVAASAAIDGASVLVRDRNGAGWRFRVEGATVGVDSSVQLSEEDGVQACLQVVLSNTGQSPADCGARMKTVRWSIARAEGDVDA